MKKYARMRHKLPRLCRPPPRVPAELRVCTPLPKVSCWHWGGGGCQGMWRAGMVGYSLIMDFCRSFPKMKLLKMEKGGG